MNWEHLRTFLWLRGGSSPTATKRAGRPSIILQTILMVVSIVSGVVALFGGIAAGYFAIPRMGACQLHACLGWSRRCVPLPLDDGIAGWNFSARSFCRSISSFTFPFLSAPLFLINYVGSVLSEHIAVFFFIPAMLGLSLGSGNRTRHCDAMAVSASPGISADGDRGDLSVSRLARSAHAQQAASANGDHGGHASSTMLLFQLPYLSTRVFGGRRSRRPPITSNEQAGQIGENRRV